MIPITTSISTLDEITVDIYPNPASDYIRINSNAVFENLMVSDVAGRVVNQTNKVNSNEGIDISGYKAGIYVVTMQNGNSVISRKIIKR